MKKQTTEAVICPINSMNFFSNCQVQCKFRFIFGFYLNVFEPVDFHSLSVRYPLYSLTIPGLRIRHALLQSGDIIAEIVLIKRVVYILWKIDVFYHS